MPQYLARGAFFFRLLNYFLGFHYSLFIVPQHASLEGYDFES